MKKRVLINTISSITYQLTAIICGFILPRLILHSYGSEVNGLVSSITQYLSVIAFLELGVGAVVQSSLYKPLAQKDEDGVSRILYSGNRFFRKIAIALAIYVVILIIFYPSLVAKNFDWLYTAVLILSISISSFAQYYFGIVDGLLLLADQKGYISYTAQTITLIVNTLVCVFEINMGLSIQLVKLTTSLIYLSRPVILRMYINRNYKIDRHPMITEEPIKQKWNGLAQHIAAVVLDDTDTLVLTVFSTLSNVSIYAVYYLVIKGVKSLFLSCSTSIQAAIGELLARGEREKLQSFFSNVEFIIHTAVTVIFSCVAILIVPFIQVYTLGVTDANYSQPLFAFLLVLAHASHCLRIPYNIVILAAGHFKQTQMNYIIASVLNIIISILTVYKYGLIGVALGTFVAMAYQTIWMAVYDSKNLLNWPIKNFIQQILVDCVITACIFLLTRWIHMNNLTYFSWIIMACKVLVTAAVVSILLNCLFYKEKTFGIMRYFLIKIKIP